MLDAWVGREEQADDEVSLAGARRMAETARLIAAGATLDGRRLES